MMRKTINVMPAGPISKFFDVVQEFTSRIIRESDFQKHLEHGEIKLLWYNDSPASLGVAVGIEYSGVEGENLAQLLINGYEQAGYNIIGVHDY